MAGMTSAKKGGNGGGEESDNEAGGKWGDEGGAAQQKMRQCDVSEEPATTYIPSTRASASFA